MLAWGLPQLRELPWRSTRDRWHILVSEVMSQQTQVDRVVGKFLAFVDAYPTPKDCARAPLGELLTLWSGLGYPRRCRNLHEAAKTIVDDHGGDVPDTLEDLLALPGVGDYTARAVLVFADHRELGIVDTNVARVLARIENRPLGKKELQLIADDSVPAGLSWEWNQVLMDFGATVCTARAPRCSECPVKTSCGWAGVNGEDPAPLTAGTSRPQGRFEGSDRQARGKLLKALTHRGLPTTEARTVMGEIDAERAQRLVEQLLDERLVVDRDGFLSLP
ncbi:MAG: A/G-specific adenine glycosylase [Ilumatobacteraceae bacterium]